MGASEQTRGTKNLKVETKRRQGNGGIRKEAGIDLVVLISLLGSYVVLSAINASWNYSPIGWVDPWAYVGHFFDPVGLRNSLPKAPSGDLLPLIWPAALLYELTDPVWANYLFKLARFLLAAYFYYLFIKNELGRPTAIVSLVSFVSYKYLLIAMGWDYTDGTVVLFLLLTLFLVSKASDSRGGTKYSWLFLSGVSFGLSISTAILSLVFLPILALFYFSKKAINGHGDSVDLAILMPVVGGVCAIVVLSTINWLYTGDFFYFLNTISKLFFFLHQSRIHGHVDGSSDWLFLPLLLILCYPTSLAVRRLLSKNIDNSAIEQDRREALFWILNLASTLILFVLEFRFNQEAVSNFSYFNQSLPFVFASAAGTIIFPLVKNLRRDGQILGFSALLTVGALGFLNTVNNEHHLKLVFTVITAGLLVALLIRFRARSVALILAITSFWLINYDPKLNYLLRNPETSRSAISSREDMLLIDAKWVKFVQQVDPGRKKFLWYNADEPNGFLRSLATSSHLWQGRVLNEHYPIVTEPMGEVGIVDPATITSGLLIVEQADESRSLIREAKTGLAARGYTLSVVGLHELRYKNVILRVFDCSVEKLPLTSPIPSSSKGS